MPKRYRSIYDAMDAVLMGAMDTSGIKTAKQLQEERETKAREGAANEKAATKKQYVQMEDILTGKSRLNEKIRKLQAVIDNPGAAPQEKESARKSIKRILEKGGS